MFYLTCKVFLSLHVHWITELCGMCIVKLMFYLTCKVFLFLHVHWIIELCGMCVVEVRSLCFT